jgi:glycosyltransferase involved in cell wall biosynthesis
MLTSVKEGSPNIIKEACACDRPIVSVDVGDVAQVLAGVSGTHVVPSERAAIAEALLRVAACPPPRRSDGRRALAEKGLDADTVARRLLRLYGQLAAGATINALPGGQ